MAHNHLLSIDQLNRSAIEHIFLVAWQLQQNDWRFFPDPGPDTAQYFVESNDIMTNQVMASVFYEPSTRTRLSFETAFLKLGGKVISVENAFDSSSDKKGESYLDTIKTISNIANIIVLRHPLEGSVIESAEIANCPIINAGDGAGEHPTQALIDLYTIWKTKQQIDELKVMIVGDLAHARTINSFKKILALFNNIEIHECDLDDLRSDNPNLSDIDVVYMTRRQIERRKDELVKGPNPLNIATLKEDAMILHPLPRGPELPVSIDADPRAKYWDQVINSVYVRQAIVLYCYKIA
jgi:aspartate carbamoyltransferase catalytic subunit